MTESLGIVFEKQFNTIRRMTHGEWVVPDGEKMDPVHGMPHKQRYCSTKQGHVQPVNYEKTSLSHGLNRRMRVFSK